MEALALTVVCREGTPARSCHLPPQSISDEYTRSSTLARVAQVLAALDWDRAERIARSITDGYSQVLALARIGATVAATDLDHAARLIADAERIAQSITDHDLRALALARVAEGVTVAIRPLAYQPDWPDGAEYSALSGDG